MLTHDARPWSFIQVDSDELDGLERIMSWAGRSKEHPLWCKIEHNLERLSWFPPHYAHRIRTLSLDGTMIALKRALEGIEEFPILESLSLSVTHGETQIGEAWHVLDFVVEEVFSRLHSLTLNNVGFADNGIWDALNLTHLSLSFLPDAQRLSVSNVAKILQQSRRLQVLDLGACAITDTFPLDEVTRYGSFILSDFFAAYCTHHARGSSHCTPPKLRGTSHDFDGSGC